MLDSGANISILQAALAVVVAMGAIIGIFMSLRFAHLLLIFVIVLSTTGVALSYTGRPIVTWLYPIQLFRAELLLGVGAILYLGAAVHHRKSGHVPFARQAVLLLCIQLYAAFIRVFHDGVQGSMESLLFATVVTGGIIISVRLLLRDIDSFSKLTRILFVANIIWITAILIQFAGDQSKLTLSHMRFLGLTANPQHAAATFNFLTLVSLWIAVNTPSHNRRLLASAITIINISFLLWTGSRTGTLMLLLGSSIVLYSRLGKAVLLMPLIAGFTFATIRLITSLVGSSGGFEHIFSLNNTRAIVFSVMMKSIAKSPIIGVGVGESIRSENSYLYGVAAYGIGMGFLILVFLFLSIRYWVALFLIRRNSLSYNLRSYIELTLAIQCTYFFGALAEGYIISRLNAVIPIFIFSAYMCQLCLIHEEYDDTPDSQSELDHHYH